MTGIYGGCVEPGGFELSNEHWIEPCPRCGAPAEHWHCERAECGAINVYSGTHCPACGYDEGERPDEP